MPIDLVMEETHGSTTNPALGTNREVGDGGLGSLGRLAGVWDWMGWIGQDLKAARSEGASACVLAFGYSEQA